jgi:hypothetical protein
VTPSQCVGFGGSSVMRKVNVLGFVSLDGVIQARGGPKEDTIGGFAYGGWISPHSLPCFFSGHKKADERKPLPRKASLSSITSVHAQSQPEVYKHSPHSFHIPAIALRSEPFERTRTEIEFAFSLLVRGAAQPRRIVHAVGAKGRHSFRIADLERFRRTASARKCGQP